MSIVGPPLSDVWQGDIFDGVPWGYKRDLMPEPTEAIEGEVIYWQFLPGLHWFDVKGLQDVLKRAYGKRVIVHVAIEPETEDDLKG